MSSGQAGQARPAPKIRGQAGGRENNKAAQSRLRPKNLYFRMLPQNHQLTSQVNTPGFQAEEVDTGGQLQGTFNLVPAGRLYPLI